MRTGYIWPWFMIGKLMRNSYSCTVQFESGYLLENYVLAVDVFLFPCLDLVSTKKVKNSRSLAVQKFYWWKETIQVNDIHVNTFTPNDMMFFQGEFREWNLIFHWEYSAKYLAPHNKVLTNLETSLSSCLKYVCHVLLTNFPLEVI